MAKIPFDQMDEFDRIWVIYPKKLSKGDARKAWKQTAKIRPDFQIVVNAVLKACESLEWRQHGGRYIPYFASWLRAERWDDVWPEQSASDATGSAEAWSTLRQCLRSNKEPPAAISAAARAIGGFNRLMELDSAVINKLQGQFEQAYRQGSH